MCVAYPGRVMAITGEMALVDIDHQSRHASTVLVPETSVGDWVVVAAGVVLRILDPDEASEIRILLDQATNPTGGMTAP